MPPASRFRRWRNAWRTYTRGKAGGLLGMNRYLELFLTFARIGVCTFGGGYAMLPILQREVVEKKGWATEDQLADYYAVGQCTPGIIAVNTATFVGYTEAGMFGGILATLGVVFPSIIIIAAIAAFLQNFADIPLVVHAFAGVRACVAALILSSVLKLMKTTVKDLPTVMLFLIILLLSICSGPISAAIPAASFLVSPVFLVVVAGVCGLSVRAARGWKA